MRKTLILPAALLVAAAVAAGAQQSGQPAQKPAEKPMPQTTQTTQTAQTNAAGKPESLEDRVGYSIGLNLGRQLKNVEAQVKPELILQGIRDGLAGGQAKLTDEEMQSTMEAFQKQVQAQQEAKQKALGEKNKMEGEAFLAKNKERPGVKTTASGLQYEVMTEGTGPMPKASDTVTVNYKGTLMDGTVFDSSYERGQPATFPLNGVIPGWTEGVQLMKVGSKYKFYIPAALGYGERGAGGVIGPNAPLIFEVELLSIGQPNAPKPQEQNQGGTSGNQQQDQQQPAEQKPPAR